jgi:DNA-sulfur modification-associated
MSSTQVGIKGFLPKPKRTAGSRVNKGRFTCYDVQWTGVGSDAFITFTITAEEIAAAAANNLLWTDQDVQRGIKPGLQNPPPRELSLADGYPDEQYYIFKSNNADDMVEKLLTGERLFLNPLIWNLRPGFFSSYWDAESSDVYIYDGKIYLPDSHHRQQAIIKALSIWRESPKEYPKFNSSKPFKVELYFLSREDEGNYFFDKNTRPMPTAKSKAYDLTTLDDLSLLAKAVIGKSKALEENVNRVTDRLTAKNPQVVTLSTLREMMRAFAPDNPLDSAEMDGLATIAATFYDMIANIRPELSKMNAQERHLVRTKYIVDSATMMHGYAALMRQFNESIAEVGLKKAVDEWKKKLQRFSRDQIYRFDSWSGDLFEKKNPLWQQVGVVKPGRDGKSLTVLNTGAARGESGRVLKQMASLDQIADNLRYLVNR